MRTATITHIKNNLPTVFYSRVSRFLCIEKSSEKLAVQQYGRIDESFSWYRSSFSSWRGCMLCETPFLHFTVTLAFGKAIMKSSRQSLHIVAEYLQAWNQPAGDCPRRDFWVIVFQFCACHSAHTILATASIFAMLFLYQFLLKCTLAGTANFSLLFSMQRNARHDHRALVSRNLKTHTGHSDAGTIWTKLEIICRGWL